jgi:hypothetical protein
MMGCYGFDSSGLRQGPVKGFIEHDDELSVPIKYLEIPE